MTDPLADLAERWREEAAVLERTGHENEAEVLRRRVQEMEDAARRTDDRWLSTEEAAEYSRESKNHLRELARREEVTAEKDGGTWRFLKSSLPRKARPPEPEGDLRPSERAARRALGQASETS